MNRACQGVLQQPRSEKRKGGSALLKVSPYLSGMRVFAEKDERLKYFATPWLARDRDEESLRLGGANGLGFEEQRMD